MMHWAPLSSSPFQSLSEHIHVPLMSVANWISSLMSVTNSTSSRSSCAFSSPRGGVEWRPNGTSCQSTSVSLSLSVCLSTQPVKADGRPPRSLVCLRFLPVKREFFLTTVAKELLMGDCWVSVNVKSLVSTCSIWKVSWDNFCYDLALYK